MTGAASTVWKRKDLVGLEELSREEIELILGHAGVRDAFRVIVAAEDVRQGKPDPEGFLRACAVLGGATHAIAPRECLVVEDSLAGLEAATRAGMRRPSPGLAGSEVRYRFYSIRTIP